MGLYLDLITEDKISDKAKSVSKSRSGISGLIQNLSNIGSDAKALSKRPNVDPSKTGDYKSLRPWLLDMVKNAKKLDRLDYLRKDAYVAINQLEKLEKNMKDVKSGHPSRYVSVRYIEKIMDSGNSPAKVREHINWMKSTYLPAIKKRKAELRKELDESAIFFI